MEFVILNREEFTNFYNKHPLRTFLQSPLIGDLREKSGWTVEYLGLKKDDVLVAATMITSIKRHFNKKEFYAPRGFLLDYNNQEILETFTNEVKNYVKKNNGYCFRIDPYVINIERDTHGDILKDGVNNINIVNNLFKLGYKRVKKDNMEQVGWMYALDVKNKTEDEIMANMKQNARNLIRKNIKDGIEVVELKKEELNEFYNILTYTGKKKGFHVRSIDYYKNMYDLFKDKVKFLVTRLDFNKHINILEEEIKELKLSLDDPRYKEGKRKSINENIELLNKRLDTAKELKKVHGDVVTMSGSMFILTSPEVVYLSSGNYDEFMNYNSQYLIQWEMIKYAINNNYDRYNFYGITGNFDKNDKDYGIYKFKTGFNGYVEELIGEYIYPTHFIYYIINLIRKIKR